MLEHLKSMRRQNFGPNECKMRRILDNLEHADRDILTECFANEEQYSTHGIYQGLRTAGIQIGYTTVSRHRDGLCSCVVTDA